RAHARHHPRPALCVSAAGWPADSEVLTTDAGIDRGLLTATAERPLLAKERQLVAPAGASVQHHTCALAHSLVALEKSRVFAGELGQHVVAFGFLFDEQPAGVTARTVQRRQPDVAVSLVKKAAKPKPLRRHLLHVVSKRAHTRHDRRAVVVREQALGDVTPRT